jgi:hypothetical protein
MQKKRLIPEKRGQMHLPLEMMFSILLVAVFLFVVFFVIRHFLEVQKCAQIGLFVRDLQSSVDEVWNVQEANTAFEREMPLSLKYVCFADLLKNKNLAALNEKERETASQIYDDLAVYFKYNNANFFFYPWQNACSMADNSIKHVNLANVSNPLCFSEIKGKVKIRLSKGFDDNLVRISK